MKDKDKFGWHMVKLFNKGGDARDTSATFMSAELADLWGAPVDAAVEVKFRVAGFTFPAVFGNVVAMNSKKEPGRFYLNGAVQKKQGGRKEPLGPGLPLNDDPCLTAEVQLVRVIP